MTERLERRWSDEVERLVDARKVACRKLQGARKRRGGRYTETISGQLQKCENGVMRKIRKEKKKLRKRTVRKIRLQGWHRVASWFGLI